MKFKTTIPEIDPSKEATSGARPLPGKTNDCDSAMTDAKVLKSKPEAIRDAVEIPGKALECIEQQVGVNGNGKKRASNFWGVGEKSIADANALKK